MRENQEIYLGLLRAALWGDNGERLMVNGESVPEVIRLAAFQGTGPLVYDQLLKLKEVDIPADLRMQMKQQCLHSMMLQQSMMPILAKAWNALVNVDIHPVLLKGFALAQYYPQPHLRQWGDIDIYVGQQNYHKASAVLRATFPDSEFEEEEVEEEKHYNIIFPNTMLETHRISMTMAHPRDRRYYEGLEERCLTKDGPKSEIEGQTVTLPEDTFNIFFVFLHAWHHFVGTGMNMKQLCDIAILLHAKRDVINKKRLREMLTKLHLMEVWQLIMFIIVHHFGVPESECPFYCLKYKQRAELLFAQILKEGASHTTERIDARGISYIKRKVLTFQMRLADSRRVRPYAPCYAKYMIISDFLHGIERTFNGK